MEDAVKRLKLNKEITARYPSVKATSISISHYFNSTGVIMRSEENKKRELMGYCSGEAKDILNILLPNYHVTQYKGLNFYSIADWQNVPMAGIAIGTCDYKGVYGLKREVNGTLEEMLDFFDESFKIVQRKNALLDAEKLSIIRNLSGLSSIPGNDSLKNAEEAIEVLTRFKS